jgi:hypothetical protein
MRKNGIEKEYVPGDNFRNTSAPDFLEKLDLDLTIKNLRLEGAEIYLMNNNPDEGDILAIFSNKLIKSEGALLALLDIFLMASFTALLTGVLVLLLNVILPSGGSSALAFFVGVLAAFLIIAFKHKRIFHELRLIKYILYGFLFSLKNNLAFSIPLEVIKETFPEKLSSSKLFYGFSPEYQQETLYKLHGK